MTTLLIPTNELVAKAWVQAAVSGLTDKVATLLPDFPWPDNEFVQISSVGGSPRTDLLQAGATVSFQCYANRANSRKPPWGQANQLALRIWRAALVRRWQPHPAVELAMPSGYGRAIVQSTVPMTEPRRIPSDPSQYAVYGIDIQVYWIPASEVIVDE